MSAALIAKAIWLVWSHEHNAWWRPKHCGYTLHIKDAGRYTKTEADSICDTRSPRRFEDDPPPEVAVIAPEFADFAEAATKRADEAERLLAVAREALDRIKRPIWWMQEDQRRKTGSINGVGHDAARLADNPAFLRGIAESTLAQLPAAPTQPTKQ